MSVSSFSQGVGTKKAWRDIRFSLEKSSLEKLRFSVEKNLQTEREKLRFFLEKKLTGMKLKLYTVFSALGYSLRMGRLSFGIKRCRLTRPVNRH